MVFCVVCVCVCVCDGVLCSVCARARVCDGVLCRVCVHRARMLVCARMLHIKECVCALCILRVV